MNKFMEWILFSAGAAACGAGYVLLAKSIFKGLAARNPHFLVLIKGIAGALTALVVLHAAAVRFAPGLLNQWYALGMLALCLAVYVCNTCSMVKAVGACIDGKKDAQKMWVAVLLVLFVFVVLLTFMFQICAAATSGAFNREISLFESVYFTVVTLVTIGYGDIFAANLFTQSVVILTAATGLITIAFMLNAVMSLTVLRAKE